MFVFTWCYGKTAFANSIYLTISVNIYCKVVRLKLKFWRVNVCPIADRVREVSSRSWESIVLHHIADIWDVFDATVAFINVWCHYVIGDWSFGCPLNIKIDLHMWFVYIIIFWCKVASKKKMLIIKFDVVS